MSSQQLKKSDLFFSKSKHPVFQYKLSGAVENSKEYSKSEEILLCLNFVRSAKVRLLQNKNNLYFYLFNNQVTSAIQGFQKPICGLVALNMAGSMLRQYNPTIPNPGLDDIYQKAIHCQVSKQGEMFSAFDMAELASNTYCCQAEVMKGNLFDSREAILYHLLHGHPVLVPYDNDKNFEPCLRSGHKSHWAIVTGAVVCTSIKIHSPDVTEELSEEERIFRIKQEKFSQFSDNLQPVLASDEVQSIHVYVKQGKSAKNRLWCLQSLARSNSNLFERDPSRDWTSYHCPRSISETLKDKAVVLT